MVQEKLPAVIEVIRAAAELQAFCESQGWRFCVIGGSALQRWGEPRETADVDLTLLTGFGGEEPFVGKLLGTSTLGLPTPPISCSPGECCSYVPALALV